MSRHFNKDVYDPYDEIERGVNIHNLAHKKVRQPRYAPRPGRRSASELSVYDESLEAQAAAENAFNFTYHAARHEGPWLAASLGALHDQRWIVDVLRKIRGGKEATVYLCQPEPTTGVDLMAAKVYRPREFRNLKDDHVYQEGRRILDGSGNLVTNNGLLQSVRKKTQLGWEVTHTSWIEYEYQTMQALYEAQADVPKPYARSSNAILMEYIGEETISAPTLNEVDLTHAEARQVYERVLHNVEALLAHNRVHGDLSAYNILYWEGRIALIDFPQVIDPERNSSAFGIFERDLVRTCQYFMRYGIHADARRIARSLWTETRRRTAPLVDVRDLDVDNPDDRRAWDRQQRRLEKERN